MLKMYGIKNCDTIKKAKRWLETANIPYEFLDYRVDGLTEAQLQLFCQQIGWQTLLNTRGTTYRALAPELKTDLNESKAISLMLAQPALIKRPLLDCNGNFLCGFTDALYHDFLKGQL